MNRSLPAIALALALAASLLGGTSAQADMDKDAAARAPIFTCDGVFTHRTFTHVRVEEGATCVLRNSTVTGNFRARHPRTVKILDTEVRRNIMIRGATRNVVIGNAGCRFDPVAGNNIKVTRSHSVAICWMTVKNNIMVRGNDGRISLFHNTVGRNIDVSRNDRYRPLPADTTKHKRPGAIRVRKNTAGGHVRLFDNDPSRDLLGLGTNTPTPEVK
ncbi:MAG TPA: hypothetical protein VFO49_04180 [Nocardioides sp.]|nr:hypothetical protein [Nocardioides sp.]